MPYYTHHPFRMYSRNFINSEVIHIRSCSDSSSVVSKSVHPLLETGPSTSSLLCHYHEGLPNISVLWATLVSQFSDCMVGNLPLHYLPPSIHHTPTNILFPFNTPGLAIDHSVHLSDFFFDDSGRIYGFLKGKSKTC